MSDRTFDCWLHLCRGKKNKNYTLVRLFIYLYWFVLVINLTCYLCLFAPGSNAGEAFGSAGIDVYDERFFAGMGRCMSSLISTEQDKIRRLFRGCDYKLKLQQHGESTSVFDNGCMSGSQKYFLSPLWWHYSNVQSILKWSNVFTRKYTKRSVNGRPKV